MKAQWFRLRGNWPQKVCHVRHMVLCQLCLTRRKQLAWQTALMSRCWIDGLLVAYPCTPACCRSQPLSCCVPPRPVCLAMRGTHSCPPHLLLSPGVTSCCMLVQVASRRLASCATTRASPGALCRCQVQAPGGPYLLARLHSRPQHHLSIRVTCRSVQLVQGLGAIAGCGGAVDASLCVGPWCAMYVPRRPLPSVDNYEELALVLLAVQLSWTACSALFVLCSCAGLLKRCCCY